MTTPAVVLVVGESLVDVVERPDGTRTEHAGGSPANVAAGLGRLGLDVRLATDLGDDGYGRLVADHLAASGVELVAPLRVGGHTSTAVARVDASGAAEYDFDVAWAPAALEVATPSAVHIGSIATVLEPGAQVVGSLVRRLAPHCVVTYDPNIRPAFMPDRATARTLVEDLVRLSDVVKISDEDIAWLSPGTDPADLARSWLALGPRAVFVTTGSRGSFAVAARGRVDVSPLAGDVVDTVGAGDAYMAGIIAALHDGGLLDASDGRLRELDADDLGRIAGFAARTAAITVGRAGAEPPWRKEL